MATKKVEELVENTEAVEDIDAIKMDYESEFKSLSVRYEEMQKELEQYKEAYTVLDGKYSRLFKLFANNLDFYLVDGGNK